MEPSTTLEKEILLFNSLEKEVRELELACESKEQERLFQIAKTEPLYRVSYYQLESLAC